MRLSKILTIGIISIIVYSILVCSDFKRLDTEEFTDKQNLTFAIATTLGVILIT